MTEVLLEDLLLTECAALDPRLVVGLLELEALELALLICSINTARTSSCKAEQNGPDEPSVRRVMIDQGNKAQRLLRVDQIYSRKSRQVHFTKTVKATAKRDRSGKTALVVLRIVRKQGTVADRG